MGTITVKELLQRSDNDQLNNVKIRLPADEEFPEQVVIVTFVIALAKTFGIEYGIEFETLDGESGECALSVNDLAKEFEIVEG